MPDKTKIALLTNIVPEYRLPIFKGLFDSDELIFKVMLSLPIANSCQGARDVLDMEQLSGINVWRKTPTAGADYQRERIPVPIGLFLKLAVFKPDVVISGDLGVRTLFAWMASKVFGFHLICWVEETSEHHAKVGRLQKQLRSFLIPRLDHFLALGDCSLEFLREQQVRPDRITKCVQAVDNEYWINASINARLQGPCIREELDVKGRLLLFVGRLIPRKGLSELVQAFEIACEKANGDATLIIIGDGESRNKIALDVELKGMKNIQFLGAKFKQQLPMYYAAADVTVFPSLVDVWGLIVNESMLCGTPVISSVHAGATREMVVSTGTGQVIDPTNIEQFSSVLAEWIDNPPNCNEDYVRSLVSEHTFESALEAIKNSVGQVVQDK
jgi:glycosyltransferase involved in cell wall biosynthesis